MKTGFACVARVDARVLILGSMPGVASLEAAQYYAHERNAFWSIMESLFSIPRSMPYTDRLDQLSRTGIALWDVIRRCRRRGSLDTSIESASIIVNDFPSLFRDCPGIRHVFFNGRKAQQLFMSQVVRKQPALVRDLALTLLPSTSPAYAALSAERKIAAWSVVREVLGNEKAAAP